jgi:hypothetical protein
LAKSDRCKGVGNDLDLIPCAWDNEFEADIHGGDGCCWLRSQVDREIRDKLVTVVVIVLPVYTSLPDDPDCRCRRVSKLYMDRLSRRLHVVHPNTITINGGYDRVCSGWVLDKCLTVVDGSLAR